MKLTEENVDKVFSECEWPFQEWKTKSLSLDEVPDAAQMLLPLPSGENVITFHPEKLRQYQQEIGELLDQVPYLSQEQGIILPMLGHNLEGITWSENIYIIQELYLLGTATDQLLSHKIGGINIIYRIPKEKFIVSLTELKKENERFIGKVINQSFLFNNRK